MSAARRLKRKSRRILSQSTFDNRSWRDFNKKWKRDYYLKHGRHYKLVGQPVVVPLKWGQ